MLCRKWPHALGGKCGGPGWGTEPRAEKPALESRVGASALAEEERAHPPGRTAGANAWCGGWAPEPGRGTLGFCGRHQRTEEQPLRKPTGCGCADGPLRMSPLLRPSNPDVKASPDPEAQGGEMPPRSLTGLLGELWPQQHLGGLCRIPGPRVPPDPALCESVR